MDKLLTLSVLLQLICILQCQHSLPSDADGHFPSSSPPNKERLRFQLYSYSSGRMVAVLRRGRVHADAAKPSGNTRFLVTTSFNESSRSVTATFQSDKFRGRYLIMTQRHRPKDQPVSTSGRRRLRLGYPQDNNQIFEVIHTDNPLYIGLRDSEGCYVGFEGNGNQLQQCTLIQDHRTKLILKIFEGELD